MRLTAYHGDMKDPVPLLAALAEPTRLAALRILWDGGEHCVCELMTKLGASLYETPLRGVHDGRVSGFALRVVETTVAWPHPHEHLLYSVSPDCITHPERVRAFDDTERRLFYHLAQGIAQLASDPKWKVIMKDATVVDAATEKALRDLFAVLSPEFKASLLTREERLAGLKPEERLAGLDPAQAVLALPDAVLRGLTEDYLDTLPDDVRATVRARLGR
jgi:DNA-binding transcriptional ArsR family regulator